MDNKGKPLSSIFKGWFDDIRVVEVICLAATYIVCARIGQIFAIEPSNVTPVWIPSGVMLALALKFGPSVWPGVFAGAFLGNIWAYFSTESFAAIFSAIASATMNGIGDVLAVVLCAQLIRYYANTQHILSSSRALAYFLFFGVLLGSILSALWGCGGLWLFGHVAGDAIGSVFMTWFLGDAVGVLTFTPFLLSWLYSEPRFDESSVVALVLATLYSVAITMIAFGLVELSELVSFSVYLPVPILFAVLFRYGQRLVFTVQLAVLSVAIYATWHSLGPFADESQIESLLKLQSFAAAFSLTLFFIAIFNLEKSVNERYLEQRAKELEQLYRKDQLTGLWNRYRIKECIKLELERRKREKVTPGILILDIDDFKKINDTYGHLEGDRVLASLSSLISGSIRDVDLAGRWGGEEFIVVISNTSIEGLNIVAEKLLNTIRDYEFIPGRKVTVSIGSTLAVAGDSELTLLDRADHALYAAKKSGKNRHHIETIGQSQQEELHRMQSRQTINQETTKLSG